MNAFELEWSFAPDTKEGDLHSSVDHHRRVVAASGGIVQRCDIDGGTHLQSRRLVRMTILCDKATLATLQSDMLFDDAISLHSVRRIDPAVLASQHAPAQPLAELVDKRIAEQRASRSDRTFASNATLRLLGAREVGLRLGNVSDQTVRIRERSGKLFSVMRPNRLRGREYPEYQLEHGIHGRPLTSLLRILGKAGGDAVHVFFITRVPALGELSPLEVLRGVAFADAPNVHLLALPGDQRLAAVLNAAERFVDARSGPDGVVADAPDSAAGRQQAQPSSTLAR